MIIVPFKRGVFMKKILSVIFCVVLLVSVLSITTAATEAKVFGSFTYKIENNEVTITKCEQNVRDTVEIPAEIENLPVTAIWRRAFANCNLIQSIIIPNTVKSIGLSAFDNCQNLKNISFFIHMIIISFSIKIYFS